MTNLGIASDVNNPNFQGASNPDAVMLVKFYMKSVQNTFESNKQGKPVFFEMPYVQIMTPGNQLSIIDTPVQERHKRRFPLHWAAFQNSQHSDYVAGTPVEEWPAITRSQAEEMKGMKFFTVEQVAGASDEQIQRLGMNAPMMRQKARAFLQTAKDTAFAQAQAVELAQRDQQIADLNATVNRLGTMLETLMKEKKEPVISEPKPKRKYTRKIKTPETQPLAQGPDNP